MKGDKGSAAVTQFDNSRYRNRDFHDGHIRKGKNDLHFSRVLAHFR